MRRRLIQYFGVLCVIVCALILFYESNVPQREILIEEPAATQATVDDTVVDDPLMPPMPVIISEDRVAHILYGDAHGGGHRHGAGKPCKSEFPQSWDDEKIIDVTRKIAANDNLDWERQGNGYYVAEAFEGAIEVRVVKGPQKRRVITAYPINVARNPCPL